MQDELVRALRARRAEIHARWEALLRIEKVNTPLANPDALVFMIDWTLDECFASLRPAQPRRKNGLPPKPDCPCGRNPLLAYFSSGEQAIEEALILEQARAPAIDPVQRDEAFSEVKFTVREIARREIEAFCSVCQFRNLPRTNGLAVASAPATAPAPAA